MPSTLAQYQTKIRATLGAYVDIASWPAEATDEGLRLALQDFSQNYPPVEGDFTVAAAGREQNLNIADLLEVISLAWPWAANASFNTLMVNWRRIGPTSVYIEDGAPAIGDKIRVRHKKLYRVQNLDSAATTTVPDTAERIVITGAAAYSIIVRRRILSENPAVPKEAVEKLIAVSEALFKEYRTQLETTFTGASPHWSTIGL